MADLISLAFICLPGYFWLLFYDSLKPFRESSKSDWDRILPNLAISAVYNVISLFILKRMPYLVQTLNTLFIDSSIPQNQLNWSIVIFFASILSLAVWGIMTLLRRIISLAFLRRILHITFPTQLSEMLFNLRGKLIVFSTQKRFYIAELISASLDEEDDKRIIVVHPLVSGHRINDQSTLMFDTVYDHPLQIIFMLDNISHIGEYHPNQMESWIEEKKVIWESKSI